MAALLAITQLQHSSVYKQTKKERVVLTRRATVPKRYTSQVLELIFRPEKVPPKEKKKKKKKQINRQE